MSFEAALENWDFGGVRAAELEALLEGSDSLGRVLKGHLAIEAALTAALASKVSQSAALDQMKLSFSRKVQLCVALGILKPQEEPAFMVLNNIRNKFAHDYHYEVTKGDAERLAKALPEYWQSQDIITEALQIGEIPLMLLRSILVLYVIAGYQAEKEQMESLPIESA